MENKFLPRTVLRSFLHKLERHLDFYEYITSSIEQFLSKYILKYLTFSSFLSSFRCKINSSPSGVHIIPKIGDFLDPKIFFAPNLKKCPQLKKNFQIPLTHFPPIAPKIPNLKNVPNLKKTFSNSTNTFAPNCPKLGKKLPPIVKNNPNYKTHFYIPLTHLPPI